MTWRAPGVQRLSLPPSAKSWLFIGVLFGLFLLVNSEWLASVTVFGSFVNWKGVQAALKPLNEGFLISALIGIYLEVMKPNSFSDFFRQRVETLDRFLKTTSNAEGVQFFLARQYEGLDGLHVLRETVISDKAVLRECRVHLWLTRDFTAADADRTYLRKYRISFQAELDRFVFATVRTSELADVLFLRGPDVTELCMVSRDADFASATEALMKAGPVRSGGKPLQFRRYEGRLDPLLTSGPYRRGSDFEVFEADVPKADDGRWRNFVVETMRRVEHPQFGRHHWVADRPLFLRDITIDVSAFPGRDKLEFDLIPFLGSVDDIGPSDFRAGEVVVHVNRWLVRGQGICLLWGPAITREPGAG